MDLTADCTAEIIKVVRSHLKMTAPEFADAVGCTRQHIWNWENAVHAPGPTWREAIADAVGLSSDLLWPDPEGSRFGNLS